MVAVVSSDNADMASVSPVSSGSAGLPSWPALILASTSSYRRELLSRLRVPFEALSPGVDETPREGESPAALSVRLACEKAKAVAARRGGDAVVIGSDQVADLNGLALGKPGDHAHALAQWRLMRGRVLVFHTAVCVVRPRAGFESCVRVPVQVRCRDLPDEHIEAYLRLEQPYDCAGSAKCETLGIALLDEIESADPTALVGLPLITTSRLLREAGLDPLAWVAANLQSLEARHV